MINGQSAAKPLNSKEQEERSTTSVTHVDSSESKKGTSVIKVEEDIVWTLDESLERFNKKYNFIYRTTVKTWRDFGFYFIKSNKE